MSLLRPHQIEPVRILSGLLDSYRSALDRSRTGTGKTYVAAAVASQSRLPTLCVVPKIAITQWAQAAKHFDDEFSIVGYEKLRAGNTPFGWWEKKPERGATILKCTSCQCKIDLDNFVPCYCHPQGIHCVEVKNKPKRYGKFTFAPQVKQIIFDEVHRCNGFDSLNSDMLIAAKPRRVLGLSATPCVSPLQMKALGYLLDIFKLPEFLTWCRYQGCQFTAWGGWKWLAGAERQKEIMATIGKQLRGVQVRYEDIPNFPERCVEAELYEIDSPEEIDGAYTEMSAALEQLHNRALLDKSPEHPLTKILRAKQKIELLKVPVFLELTSDALAKGQSVGLFLNYRQTIEEIGKRLNVKFSVIQGEQTEAERNLQIGKYQSNEHRVCLINSLAGKEAVSLPDLTGEHPRVGYVSPPFSAVTAQQLIGRFHRESSKSACYYRFIFAAKTVEVATHRSLRNKLNNLDALNDADLTPNNLSFNV